MGVLDGLFPSGLPQPAPTLDGILGAGPDLDTLARVTAAAQAQPGMTHQAYAPPQLSDTERMILGLGMAPAMATYNAVGGAAGAVAGLPGLARDAYSAFGGGAPSGLVTENSAQDAQTDAAGRALGVAGTMGGASAPIERPAGSLGVFGGRAADATGAQRIAGNNRFVADLQRGADDAAKEHVLSLIPPPTSIPDRAVQGTVGMSVPEIMSSEPLWGYSRTIADAQGVPHSEAFASLANHLFQAHGHAASLSPSEAKGFMQMERLKYGMDPTTD